MATSAKTTKATTSGKSTARKSTAAGKSATTAKAAAKVPAKAKVKLTGVTDSPDIVVEAKAPAAPVYKMQDLMQALEGKSELKRGELRQTVGHVLEALGAALAQGNDVSLPGFGKITAKRRETKPGGEQIIARIKLNTPEPDPVRTPTPGED
jgi:nucleoid DNA-binding protein